MPSRRERRRRPPPRRAWPIVAGTLALAAAAAGVFTWWSHVRRDHVVITFTGSPAVPIDLTFFPDRLAFAAPSPPAPLGRLSLDGMSRVRVGRDLVPGSAVVRYAAPGIGTGFRHLQLGADAEPIVLRAPSILRGRVVEPIAAWSQGWRCVGQRPVGDAEVVVMGGGEHGVELASARSDDGGRFEVGGVDVSLDGLALRVRAPGFALVHLPLRGERTDPLVAALAPAELRRGRIAAPAGFDVTTLRVLARGMPGVEAVPHGDGTFVLDHVPAGLRPSLLLHGLGAQWTHVPVRADQDVRIEIVAAASLRGRVVEERSRDGVAGALVSCGEAPAVYTDAAGRFELVQLLPGEAKLVARHEEGRGRRRQVRSGSRIVSLRAGECFDVGVVTIE